MSRAHETTAMERIASTSLQGMILQVMTLQAIRPVAMVRATLHFRAESELRRDLKGRHMQMIAIGGAIGSGLFIGSGGSFVAGGPAAVIIGFIVIGIMMYLMMQALAELAVMYPINGAFTMYICRFIDPSWGFACGWQYAISWLTVLPFEISAACNIIHYWPGSHGINNAAWITPLLVALVAIQFFGVRGYGEVEFVLSMIKILACLGFLILGIIINVGGVPSDNRGYIGNKYYNIPGVTHDGFRNGFHGFCGVFVNAAFAYTGTELTGLAAAETDNPRKEIPKALETSHLSHHTILHVPVNNAALNGSAGASSLRSPFVIAINLLESSHERRQLLPLWLHTPLCKLLRLMVWDRNLPAYVDKKGRPVVVIIIQLLFGLLAYIQSRSEWRRYLHLVTVIICHHCVVCVRQYCTQHTFVSRKACSLPCWWTNLSAENFFENYMAAPFLVVLYLMWKVYSWFKYPSHRPLWIRTKDIDIYSGMRQSQREMISGEGVTEEQRRASIQQMQEEQQQKKGFDSYVKAAYHTVFLEVYFSSSGAQ
ncbi:high-affinity amino acid transporter [Bipolaris maydis]|nr:high-affinity amino acid transporter [Bipolaris maydis]